MDAQWRSGALPCDVEVDCAEEIAPRVPIHGLHMGKEELEQDFVDGGFGKGERVDSIFDSGLDSLRLDSNALRSQDFSSVSDTQAQLDRLKLVAPVQFPSTDLTQTRSLHSDTRDSVDDEGFHSGRLSSYLSEELFPEIKNNEVQAEVSVLEKPAQVDEAKFLQIFTRDEDGDTQLHMAVIHGHSAVAMKMIDCAPDYESLNIKNDLHQTPLHLAVCTYQADVARRLVTRGAQVDSRDRHGNTPLHIACHNGDRECMKALTRPISHQELQEAPNAFPFQRIPQDPEIKNYDGKTCFHLAADGAHLEVMAYLISRQFGSNINARDGRSGRTALHHAIESRNLNTIALLLRLVTVDVNVCTFDGSTPVSLAMGRGYNDIVQALVDRGAKIPAINTESDSDSNYDSDEELYDEQR